MNMNQKQGASYSKQSNTKVYYNNKDRTISNENPLAISVDVYL